MNNYEACARWVLKNQSDDRARVLDFGCGRGEIVEELRKRDVDAFGCDAYYDGGDYAAFLKAAPLGDIVRKMVPPDYAIPFDSGSFDIVVNNQVMEHVEDLDRVLGEIHRVLKPGGAVLSLFPAKGVWREGHSGVPFLHWFPKHSRPRVYYAAACRCLGFGYFKNDKSIWDWSEGFCDWLDKWTFYRDADAIYSSYQKYFKDIRHIEHDWFGLRLESNPLAAIWLPDYLKRLIVQKLAGWVFVAFKAGT